MALGEIWLGIPLRQREKKNEKRKEKYTRILRKVKKFELRPYVIDIF